MIFGLFTFERCEQCCWVAGEASPIDFQLALLADEDAAKSRSIVAFQSNNRAVGVVPAPINPTRNLPFVDADGAAQVIDGNRPDAASAAVAPIDFNAVRREGMF